MVQDSNRQTAAIVHLFLVAIVVVRRRTGVLLTERSWGAARVGEGSTKTAGWLVITAAMGKLMLLVLASALVLLMRGRIVVFRLGNNSRATFLLGFGFDNRVSVNLWGGHVFKAAQTIKLRRGVTTGVYDS